MIKKGKTRLNQFRDIFTRSSILRIMRTHSVARVRADWVTRAGWRTFSVVMSSLMLPLLMEIPAYLCPRACLFLSSVTMLMGLRPAFSARVYGMTSRASANARTIKELTPFIYLDIFASCWEISTSGTPPPGTSPLFFTRERTTHKASCKLLSASSITLIIYIIRTYNWKKRILTREFEPRHKIVMVLAFDWTPVIFKMRESSDNFTSSQRSAWPNFSGVRLSMWAMGTAPIVYIFKLKMTFRS